MSLSRRNVLLGLGGLGLSGCAAPGSTLYQVFDVYRALDRAKKEYPASREVIESQPSPVLGVQVEDGVKGLIQWQKREKGLDYWLSGNQVEIVTQQGRLIRTRGFPQDQLASRLVSGADPFGAPLNPESRYETVRQIDLAPELLGLEARGVMEYEGRRRVSLHGLEMDLDEWSETVRVSIGRRRKRWRQLFQVDAQGQVWRSIQHVGEDTRVILEVLKPIGSDA